MRVSYDFYCTLKPANHGFMFLPLLAVGKTYRGKPQLAFGFLCWMLIITFDRGNKL